MTASSTISPISSSTSALAGRRVAIISASWHTDVVHQARDAAAAELQRLGLASAQLLQIDVPGALEIPLMAQKLIASGKVDAVIACAVIVNGGIYRHEFVSSAVIDGLMRVQLDSGVPVLSAVLTPRDFHEHDDHVEFFRSHFVKKGVEVAQACVGQLRQLAAADALLAAL